MEEDPRRKKKSPYHEYWDDEEIEFDEDSDIPVHERYTRQGKRKHVRE